MKTIVIILAIFSGINLNVLLAGTPGTPMIKIETNKSAICSAEECLAPIAPKEADFDEEVYETYAEITFLKPVAPKEADFDVNSDDTPTNFDFLKPVTPKEADFEE